MKLLLTGGLGYIGSHTAVELLECGHEVIIVDNLSNTTLSVKDNIEKITHKKVIVYVADCKDEIEMDKIFKNNKIDGVIHFAGFKAVGESVQKPLMYFENNLESTIVLLKTMQKYGVNNFVFSSSATVYGEPKKLPITEDSQLKVSNPYGRTKLMIEEILEDVFVSNPKMNIVILRYFNPIGAHKSGLLGENPKGIPNNIMPYMTRVATGKLPELTIFGNDYPTKDGTGVRDYIHITDLALGHVCAVDRLSLNKGLEIFNLGTGHGVSVLELVNTFNSVCGNLIKYKIGARRSGDCATVYASAQKAERELHWKAKNSLSDACLSSYLYEKNCK